MTTKSTSSSSTSSRYTVSKMVTDRQKAAADLAAVLESHAEEAQEALATAIAPYLDEGETAPNLFVLQKALRRRLVDLDRELVTADDAALQERLDDRGVRRQRNEAVAELAHRLSRLRAGVEAAYGAGSAAELVEMEGPVPRDPVVLHRVATRVLEALREDPFADHESQLRGIVLDATAWVEDLEEPLARLGHTLQALVLEERDSVSSLLRKKRAMQDYDEAYLTLARAFENLFRHVGLGDLSRTVRPRRRSRLHRPEEQVEAPAEVQIEAQTEPSRQVDRSDAAPSRAVSSKAVSSKAVSSRATETLAEPWPELRILEGGLRRRGSPTD